ncbi:MAG: TolC family protein [Acidobacteria bacterium]|nr:TolC family protein [Acidobacteriota bacterium]
MLAVPLFSQPQPTLAQTQARRTSEQFVAQDGLNIDRLIELGRTRRADLLAARQRLAIAEGKLLQAGLRPNPTLDAEYGSPRFLGGESEYDLSVGISQVLELGGKRSRRVAVAELELLQVRAEIVALERHLIVGIRSAYTGALSAARQLDVLERLMAANEEIVRITEARLKEGDVAPLDVNLVKVENDRLKVQAIQAQGELESALLEMRTVIGADLAESLRLAPQPERPPRFDLGLSELTEIALRDRPDLQAARLGEELGAARIGLARANATPNIAGSVRYSRSKGIVDLPGPVNGSTIASDSGSELAFGVSIDIPIFNRNQGEIAAATGERLQATRTREFLESTVKRDVAVAYRKYRAAAEAVVIYSTQILPRAEDNLRSVRAAYGLGDFSIFEVVNEQRRLAENVTNYNQVLRDYYNALTELETAIGTTLPARGFAPGSTSVLPDTEMNPRSIDRAEFLRSLMERKLSTNSAPTRKVKREKQ